MAQAARYRIPHGVMEVVVVDDAIVSARLTDDRMGGSRIPWLCDIMQRYSDGDIAALDEAPVLQHGPDFRMRAWQAMRTIPAGEVLTYGELASRAGNPGAARAAGTACALNTVMLFVPCHRIVASAGLGGYAYGLDLKRALLQHEGCELD
jgi:methylated-DNA-[protein]-cysteine S-methyltransferase